MKYTPHIKRYKLGIRGEIYAKFILFLKGYKILHSRYKVRNLGEIDLIAVRGNYLIFFEVKARKNKHLNIEEILSPWQIKRIKLSAQNFYEKNKEFHKFNIRFDYIQINNLYFRHFKNYF